MFKLFENGKICADLVYGDNTDAADDNAVAELCYIVRRCSINVKTTVGGDLHAFPHVPPSAQYVIFTGGDNTEAKRLGLSVPSDKFDDDTVYIKVSGNYAVLSGGKRGKIYAVYEFAERFLGVRFYHPENTKYPLADNVMSEDFEYIYTPQIKYRNVYSYDFRLNRDYLVRNRLNSENDRLALKHYGEGLKWSSPGAHTTFNFLFPPEDPETGYDKHPEYYSYLKKYGKRVGRHHDEYKLGFLWGEGEICWTNKDVIEILAARLKQWILDNPHTEYFAVSQNDWNEHCECPECEKIARKYGVGNEPRWSAPIIYCLNELGKKIKQWQKSDPRFKGRNIYVCTLAYQYGVMPPVGMTAEDNVAVRVTTHDACFYHNFDDETCPVNRRFKECVEGWGKILKQVFVWDYATNHGMQCGFNTILKVYADNMRFFARNNVVGLFEEFSAMGRLGLWFNVRQYLYAKAMWDPDLDFSKEFAEAMRWIYKDAAPYLMEIERKFVEQCAKIENFHPNLAYTIMSEYYTPEFLSDAEQLFEIALSACKDEETRLAVRREYVCLKWTKMFLNKNRDFKAIKDVCAELEELGIYFPKMDGIREHFFGGKKNDAFLDEIALRNRNAELKKLQELL